MAGASVSRGYSIRSREAICSGISTEYLAEAADPNGFSRWPPRGFPGWLWVIVALMFFVLPAAALANQGIDTSISLSNDGTVHFEAPWGSFVAIPLGDGEFRVVTARQYELARVRAISASDEMRESIVKDDGATMTFVVTGSLKTRIGSTPIDGIYPQIQLSWPVYGDKHHLFRSVDVTWFQNSGPPIFVVLYDQEDRQAIASGSSEQVGNGVRDMLFAVPRTSLSHPFLLIFFSKNLKPSILRVRSIAWQNAIIFRNNLVCVGWTKHDHRYLNDLRILDNRIAPYSTNDEPESC